MKIKLNQSGGFAGVMRSFELDTTTLDPKSKRSVQRVLREVRGLGAPALQIGRDGFSYQIVIDDGKSSKTFNLDGETAKRSTDRLVKLIKESSSVW